MLPRFQQWYGRHKVLCWVAAGLVMLYTVVGFVVAPLVLDHTLRNNLSQMLHRKVQVDSVRINPYTFSLRLIGFSVSDREGGRFVHVGDLYINVDPLISLFKWGVVVKSVEIDAPQVTIVRTSDGGFNFSDMIPPPETAGQTDGEPGKQLRWVLMGFKLTDGEIRYTDQLQPQPFASVLSALNASFDWLDTRPDAEAALYRLALRSEADEKLEIIGGVDLHPLNVTATLRLDDVAIAKYAPYYRDLVDATVKDGRIGLQADVTWSENARSVDDILFTVSRLSTVDRRNQPLLEVPLLQAEDASIDLGKRIVRLGRVTTRDGRVDAHIDGQGQLNLTAAFAPPPSAGAASAGSDPKGVSTDTPSWQVEVPAFALENYTVRYQDQQTDPVADITVRQLFVDARALSNQNDARGTVDTRLKWAEQGTLALGGDVGLVPLQADLTVQADGLDVRPLQPYINRYAQLVVTKGLLASKGSLKIDAPKADALDIRYTGQVAMNQFKSVDRRKAGDFLIWKSLYLNGVDFGTAPFKLTIDEVALTDFYNRLIINADGSSNLAMVMGGANPTASKKSGESEPVAKAVEPKTKSAEPNIKINTVTLQGGKVDFSDLYVKPNVRLPMQQIGGRVSGLDAIRTHKADVLLKGKVGSNVPIEIKGRINPFIEKPFVDITLGLKGVDLSPFTPYSGKYLGYKLDKGQLSLDLAYRVADNKLSGKNKVLLNQLTLGETVSSPTATKLPIKLALALLKDRQGNIDLELPVTGDLDDPEFSIGGIVIKMFVNLIVNIVSSPFKVLGSLFGGGEELAYLDFESGQSRLPDASSEKLDTLAKILFERPGLRLEIQGQVQRKEDIDGLRRLRFDAQLKDAKLKSLVAKGKKAVPLEQIELTPEERNKRVRKAYKAARFPKPRDEKGALKKLSPEEMEKLLYTAIGITDDDLRLLAHRRASAAKAYLADHGKVEVQRLFIVEPKIESEDAKEELRSRVKFNLT